MENYAKLLTRIQLVNWHFFENERICINRSALISGENTAGKSTILDAIQLVITTNSKKFNMAANEKGKRDLKGYVRCKVGNVGETYHRKGRVPANVALEFYEEKTDRYFVMGVHLLSEDDESPVEKKWYVEECRLEDLSFITAGKPSLANEFRNKTNRIKYIESDRSARDRFRHRMGNIDEKFFDIIPKSLAFKPMDNVKDFINKFVLSEEKIDIKNLRNNIYLLDNLDNTLTKTKKQLSSLKKIINVFDSIEDKNKEILINDILLITANKDALNMSIDGINREIDIDRRTIEGLSDKKSYFDKRIQGADEEIVSLNVSIQSNESSKLIDTLEHRVADLRNEFVRADVDNKKLAYEIRKATQFFKIVKEQIDGEDIIKSNIAIMTEVGYEDEKAAIVADMDCFLKNEFEQYRQDKASYDIRIREEDKIIGELREKQNLLEKRQLKYPEHVVRLKTLIEEEFAHRGIRSSVYILSELLDIDVADERWRNAVEGYLNTQKFYLIIEPDYVNIALEVYDMNRDKIYSAGVINTKKLPMDYEENRDSLAHIIKTDNRYAKAYIEYVLGRVIRCDKVTDLEQYKIAITPECMLYQGYVVRHLNPGDYREPYIGMNAYRVQLSNVKSSISEHLDIRQELKSISEKYISVIKQGNNINIDVIRDNMNAPDRLHTFERELAEVNAELVSAKNNPIFMELGSKLEDKEKELDEFKKEKDDVIKEQAKLEEKIENLNIDLKAKEEELVSVKQHLEDIYKNSGTEYDTALKKYNNNKKTKTPDKIKENFSPQKTRFQNEKENLIKELYDMQSNFNIEFSLDFTLGVEEETQYREAAAKLERVEIVRYEEKLKNARADCEKIFRSDFLSKMKEYIENAKLEFRNLNNALRDVYYGDDSYRFYITFDKRKENLYKMITSEYNMEGDNNIFTDSFEREYKDEIEELFDKLMVSGDRGDKIVEEYTDYRSYLDYDIHIHKRDGQKQKYSEIYGEKSGSETQVPYYVAIAASFYQLYRFGNSVRLMLLDEAFDKMDDDRIKSMLEFMDDLNLQVIMATPPAKIEIIGEKVGCILTAIREGNRSIVEEYEL